MNAAFTLNLQGEENVQAQLKRGYSYCLIVRSDTQRKSVLEALAAYAKSAIVANNGGLISNLPVWENLVLPAQYHNIEVGGKLDVAVLGLLDKCGVRDESSVNVLLRKLPDQLSLYEKRLVGFIRAMLMAPEIIVYDSLHEGLSPREMQKTARFDRIFRLYYPFRTSVLLSFEEYRDAEDSQQVIIKL